MAALDNGFKRAYATIVDANVTSLIATGLLFYFGSGTVRGFAVTVFLGTCLSMFTAVAITRIIMTEVVARRRMKQIAIEPLVRFFTSGSSIQFMRGRFIGIGASIVLSLASIALVFKPGLNYGIDFQGGIQLEITTQKPVDLAELRGTLGELRLGEVILQQVGGDKTGLIRLHFALPMAVGVIIATTSSIFIAAPILLFLGTWWQRRQMERTQAAGQPGV